MSTENNTESTGETGTDITLLPPADRAVIVLNSTEAEKKLKLLVAESVTIKSVIDQAGRDMAHRAAMNLRNARTSITKTGKEARDDATAFAKAVVAEEKRLIAITQEEEDRIFALRDAYDAKVKAEKEEADRIEAARLARIAGKIDYIRGLPLASFRDSAADIQATIDDLTQFDLVTGFDEKQEEAEAARTTALAELAKLLETAQAAEIEAERVRQQAAELEQERLALAAERKRLDDEAAAERAELAQLRAEKAQREAAASVAAPVQSDPVAEPAEDVVWAVAAQNARDEGFADAADVAELVNNMQAAEDGDLVAQAETIDSPNTPQWAPGNLTYEICQTTGLQFHELSKKVTAAGFYEFAAQLITIADQLMDGVFEAQVGNADVEEFRLADIALEEISRRSQTSIYLINKKSAAA